MLMSNFLDVDWDNHTIFPNCTPLLYVFTSEIQNYVDELTGEFFCIYFHS